MKSSNGNIFRVTSHLCDKLSGLRWIPRTKPVAGSFGVFFDLRLNKRLSKQSWGWWFEMLSSPLWRHCNDVLTHWGQDKMDAIYQTVYSNAFSWKKMYGFRLRLHWSLFLMFELTIFPYRLRQRVGAHQALSHKLNRWWLDCWQRYASLGFNELMDYLNPPKI